MYSRILQYFFIIQRFCYRPNITLWKSFLKIHQDFRLQISSSSDDKFSPVWQMVVIESSEND
jgi:hypothetical protein